jgi:metal-sulfur cluster biosynthetic enzyme
MSDDTPTVEKPAEGAQPAPAGKPSALPEAEITRLTDEIVTALKTVYDPEIPADIYEIGLIYRIDIADDRTVKVDMSLTSPNCPSAQELPVMVQNAVSTVPEWERSMSAWSGTRPGTRAGCRKRRASSSTCCELPFRPEAPTLRAK